MPEEQTAQAHINTNIENTIYPYSTNTETYNTGADTCLMNTYICTQDLLNDKFISAQNKSTKKYCNCNYVYWSNYSAARKAGIIHSC